MDVASAQALWRPEPGWLTTASYGLPPDPSWDALQAALADWRGGRVSWESWDEATGLARASFHLCTTERDVDLAVAALTA